MADENEQKPNTGTEGQGAEQVDLDESQTGNGNPPPPEPENKPPVKEPTAEEKAAAEKAAADKEAADKAAAEEAEKAKAEAEKENAPLDKNVWGDLGDDVGNSVLQLLQNSGISTDEAKALLFDAAVNGDITKVDKAALVAKVGEAKANLILAGTENYISKSKAKAEAIVKDVHTTVGGKENWDAVTTWAKDNVPEDELTEYRAMIDKGGPQARFAATELANRYNGDGKNTTLNSGDELLGDGKANTQGRKLTRGEYVAELQKAYDKNASEVVINEIKAARARGRAAGI